MQRRGRGRGQRLNRRQEENSNGEQGLQQRLEYGDGEEWMNPSEEER